MFRIQYRYHSGTEWRTDCVFDDFDEAIKYLHEMEDRFGYGSGNYMPHRLIISTEVDVS